MRQRRKYQYFALLLFTSLILLLIKTAKSTSTSTNLPKQISQRNTIGLETYISKENGYSIKYPFYAELREIEIDGMRGVEILGPKIFIDSWSDYSAYRLQIIIHENPDNLSARNWAQKRLLKEWREKKPDAPFAGPVTDDGKINEGLIIDTQINGLPAYQEKWEGRDFSVMHTYIANDEIVYELIYEDYPVATYPITDVVKGIYLMMFSTFEIMPASKAEVIGKRSENSRKSDVVSVSDKERTAKITSPEMEKIPPAHLFQRAGTGIVSPLPKGGRGVVLGDTVRVRDNPTLVDSQIAFKLNAGDKVEILDRTETKESFSEIEGILLDGGYPWYKVKKDNNVGWIYGQFLQLLKPPSGVSVVKIDLYSKSVWYSESFANSESKGRQDATKYYLPLPEWSYHKTYIPLKYDICAYLLNNSREVAQALTLELKVYYLLDTMTDELSISKDAKWKLAHTFSRKIKSLPAGQLIKIFVNGIDFEDDYDTLVKSNDGWLWKVKVEAEVNVANLTSQPYQSEIMIIYGD